MGSVAQQVFLQAPARRRRIAWSSVVLAVLAVALRLADPALIERPRLAFFDFLQSTWPRSQQDSRVVIVDIDEVSLASIGQWPWPRSILARLTEAIAGAEPAVIGIDVLFPEADRLSPEQFVRSLPASIGDTTRTQLLSLPINDELLADSFRQVPVVLAMAAQPVGSLPAAGHNGLPSSAVSATGDPGAFLTAFGSVVASIDTLDAAASGRGMVTLPPDEDGVVRRIAAAVRVGGELYPSLAVEMLRVAADGEDIVLAAGDLGIEAVRLAGATLPTDATGHLWLRYGRPGGQAVLSASDLLDGRLDPARLNGKLVMLGTTAAGLADFHATPLGDRRPGVEIHAQLLDNILQGDLLMRPSYMAGVEVLLLLLAAVLFLIARRQLPGWRLSPVLIALLALALAVPILAYLRLGLLVDPTLAAVLLVLLYFAAITEGVLSEEWARRRTEDQLRQALLRAEAASKAKTDFLANMSHELRTPLTAILGFSETIQNQVFGPIAPARYGDYVNQIHTSGSHLLAIVTDVLDMSRVEAGEAKLDETDVALDTAVEESLQMLRPRIEKKRLQVDVDVGRAPRLRADRRMVKQMLLNLLGNAVTFTPNGGSIRISAGTTVRGQIAVEIRDTGIGIAKADLRRVMEPFHIAENPHVRSYQGIGLGLPLTRSLAGLHGGTLTLDSELGVGTVATLTFPAERTLGPSVSGS
jgi:signal transduction histidine kinase